MFTAFLGGFVALLEKSGGFAGFAKAISSYAKSSRSGQLVAYLAGGIIFFDDYANCLVVGGSLRPTLDMLSVSREKLAFIVDATAAPIASLVPVSSVRIYVIVYFAMYMHHLFNENVLILIYLI